MNQDILQLIECVTTANKDALQSLLAVGFYALAVPKELEPLAKELDYSQTATQILSIEDELPSIPLLLNKEAVGKYYYEGHRRFYSAIKGRGGYFPTEHYGCLFRLIFLLLKVLIMSFCTLLLNIYFFLIRLFLWRSLNSVCVGNNACIAVVIPVNRKRCSLQ